MYQTHSLNDYKLINFNVPNHLINSFDEMVKYKRVSRTSQLIGLMERWLRNEVKQMEEDNKFNHLVMDMKLRNKTSSPLPKQKTHSWEDSYDDTPPSPLFDDGSHDDWRMDLLR